MQESNRSRAVRDFNSTHILELMLLVLVHMWSFYILAPGTRDR